MQPDEERQQEEAVRLFAQFKDELHAAWFRYKAGTVKEGTLLGIRATFSYGKDALRISYGEGEGDRGLIVVLRLGFVEQWREHENGTVIIPDTWPVRRRRRLFSVFSVR